MEFYYIFFILIAGFIIVFLFEEKITNILRVKKFYNETLDLIKDSKTFDEKETYAILLNMYKSRLEEYRKESPKCYKATEFFYKIKE